MSVSETILSILAACTTVIAAVTGIRHKKSKAKLNEAMARKTDREADQVAVDSLKGVNQYLGKELGRMRSMIGELERKHRRCEESHHRLEREVEELRQQNVHQEQEISRLSGEVAELKRIKEETSGD